MERKGQSISISRIANRGVVLLSAQMRRRGVIRLVAGISRDWESKRESILLNARYRELPPGLFPRLRELSALQFDVLSPWSAVRHDYISYREYKGVPGTPIQQAT